MKVTILIISKNRKEDLIFTLNKIKPFLNLSIHEVLVLLDGATDGSEELVDRFQWVVWTVLTTSIGASAARHELYSKSQGGILIGLDDDAHPLDADFVGKTISLFGQYPTVAIIAFQEIKGIYESNEEALKQSEKKEIQYFTNDFIGCGFAILKSAYMVTNGFPIWLDIYGEESCVSMEILANGHDILYTNTIKINHRVNKEQRKLNKQNYFRFGKQLKNATYYFLVYYPSPLIPILKMYWHNFKKYALTDYNCFKIFFKTIWIVVIHAPTILKYRNPVNKNLIKKIRSLPNLKF